MRKSISHEAVDALTHRIVLWRKRSRVGVEWVVLWRHWARVRVGWVCHWPRDRVLHWPGGRVHMRVRAGHKDWSIWISMTGLRGCTGAGTGLGGVMIRTLPGFFMVIMVNVGFWGTLRGTETLLAKHHNFLDFFFLLQLLYFGSLLFAFWGAFLHLTVDDFVIERQWLWLLGLLCW